VEKMIDILTEINEKVTLGIECANLKSSKAIEHASSARFVAFASIICSCILGLVVILK
jgi:hypothetical protein